MKKTLICFLLIFCLLLGVTGAFAVAGGEDDPLISLSWAKNWASELAASLTRQAQTDLNAFGKTAISASKSHGVAYPTSYTMLPDSTVDLTAGCSFTLASGKARVRAGQGTLVNTSTGRTVSNGDVAVGQMYVVCENSTATVAFSEAGTLLVSGEARVSGNVGFSDVGAHEWFFPYVTRGVALGLIHGLTETTFAPDRTLTVAETITLAAQLHSMKATGAVNVPTTAAIWYDNYRSYCLEHGIIDAGYANYTDRQMNAPATRSEFVHIFYHAMPENSLAPINDIADDAIPDLKLADAYGDEIYTFYRAGILSGYTNSAGYADHAFGPGTSIRRNEMAVILVHLADQSTRVTFTIE